MVSASFASAQQATTTSSLPPAVVVTTDDLGVENVGTLPTSNFYFFKELKRGFARMFTFDPIKKAELELKITNEKAAELLAVSNTATSTASEQAVSESLDNYIKAQARLKERIQKLEENSQNPQVSTLLQQIDEKTARHAMLVNQITTNMTERRMNGIVNPIGTTTLPMPMMNEKFFEMMSEAQQNNSDFGEVSMMNATSTKERAQKQIDRATEIIKKATTLLPTATSTTPVDQGKYNLEHPFRNLLANATEHLALAQKAFDAGKYGEAFGQARSAEMLAMSVLRGLENIHQIITSTSTQNYSPRSPEIPRPYPQVPPDGSGKLINPGDHKNIICTQEFAPVCGVNNVTFPNTCYAKASGIDIKHNGACSGTIEMPAPGMPHGGTQTAPNPGATINNVPPSTNPSETPDGTR